MPVWKKILLAVGGVLCLVLAVFIFLLVKAYKEIPFHIAHFMEVRDMEEFASDFPLDVNAKSADGNPLIMEAVFNSNDKMVRYLIKKGADVNARGMYDMTALEVAVSQRRYSIAEALLAAGANPNISVGTMTSSAMSLSVTKDGGDAKMLKMLADAGGKVNAEYYDGMTLLMVAVENDANMETVRLLLELGNDISAVDDSGKNVLSYAAMFETDTEVIRYLIEKGADVNHIAPGGYSVLDIAYFEGRPKEIIDLLVRAGAKTNIVPSHTSMEGEPNRQDSFS